MTPVKDRLSIAGFDQIHHRALAAVLHSDADYLVLAMRSSARNKSWKIVLVFAGAVFGANRRLRHFSGEHWTSQGSSPTCATHRLQPTC